MAAKKYQAITLFGRADADLHNSHVYDITGDPPPTITLPHEINELKKKASKNTLTEAEAEEVIEFLKPAIDELNKLHDAYVMEFFAQDRARTAEAASKQAVEDFLAARDPAEIRVAAAPIVENPVAALQVGAPAAAVAATAPAAQSTADFINSLSECKGTLADEISTIPFGGQPLKPGSTEFLQAMPTMPPPELVAAVKSFITATTNPNKGKFLNDAWDIAASVTGTTKDIAGAIPLLDAVHSGLLSLFPNPTDGRGIIRAGQVGSSYANVTDVQALIARRTVTETNDLCSLHMEAIRRGNAVGVPRSVYGPPNGLSAVETSVRYYLLPELTAHNLQRRTRAQLLVLKAIVQAIPELPDDFEHIRELKSLLLVFKTSLNDTKYVAEVSGGTIPASVAYLSIAVPNINIASNACALILKDTQARYRVADIASLGRIVAQQLLLPGESLNEAVTRCLQEAQSFEPPNPLVNFGNLGFTIAPSLHGRPATFVALTEDRIACTLALNATQYLDLSNDARSLFTDGVIGSIHDASFTLDDLRRIDNELASRGIALRCPAQTQVTALYQPAAFGAVGGIIGNPKLSTKFAVPGGKGDKGGQGGGGKGTSKRAPPARKPSVKKPGDKSGLDMYTRAVEYLGPNFVNLRHLARHVNKYFKDDPKVNSECFKTDKSGQITVPLDLHNHFAWKALENVHKNFDCRRDIYAAMQVLRDVFTPGRASNPNCKLTKLGADYQSINNSWKAFTKDDWRELSWQPSTSAPPPLKTIQISGAKVTEFTYC